MASISVSTFKTELAAALHSTSLDKVRDVNGLIYRAGRQLLQDIDPLGTVRVTEITLYHEVYDYSPPSDLKGDKIIDIAPQVERNLKDNVNAQRLEEFDLYKLKTTGLHAGVKFSVLMDDFTKILRVSKDLGQSTLINSLDGLTSNGTWAAVSGGGASAVAEDTIIKAQGGSSVSFDVSATGGAIENSTMSSVDVSDHESRSSLFVWLYIPSGQSGNVSSVALRIGSDSSNYFSGSATTPHNRSAFSEGWNLIRIAWSGMTETGTADTDNIDYLRVTVTTTASASGYRVDAIYSKMPFIHDIVYYSQFLFRAGTTWQETISADTNSINLDTDETNLLFFKTSEYAGQQLGGQDAGFDISYFKNEYNQGIARYTGMYPSQTIRPRNFYYRIKK